LPGLLADNREMGFDSRAYGPAVAEILALDGNGCRLMPLAQAKCSSPGALQALQTSSAVELFPEAHSADAALAGLYFYFNCWHEAHECAQAIRSRDGAYWHAIVHRQEPDGWNSSYWFRQVGAHPVFPQLRDRAAELGVDFGPKWEPDAFIDFCEQARTAEGSDLERQAMEIQSAEWQLLFDYCATL
jgi:hypothetical protein